MKAILVIDVPTLDDGRHLCNECPIWNRDRFLCEYDFNMEAKGCPLKPMSEEEMADAIPISFLKDKIDLNESWGCYGYAKGLQSAIDEWEKQNESTWWRNR